MRTKNNKSGFTLLEIIIVIIIIGILASLALPRFFRTVTLSRASEALNAMGVVKRGADACALLAGGGTASLYAGCTNWDQMGVDDPASTPGSSFTYGIPAGSGATWDGTNWNLVAVSNADAADTITLNYNTLTGVVTRVGAGRFAGIQ